MVVRAYGRSMWPFLPPGAQIEVEPLGRRLPEIGEIVVGVRNGRIIAHRVVCVDTSVQPPAIITRGDAQHLDDPPWTATALLGVVRTATVYGIRLPLDHPAAVAFGRTVARHPVAVAVLRQAVAQPAARLVRLVAVLATRTLTASGILAVSVAPLGPQDERDLDRLLLMHGVDLPAAAERRGTTLARDLLGGSALGARLAGWFVGAVLPPGWLEPGRPEPGPRHPSEESGAGSGSPDPRLSASGLPGRTSEAGRAGRSAGPAVGCRPFQRPILVVHPFGRGSVERPLVEAARERGLGDPAPLVAPAPWLRALLALSGVRFW